MDKQLKMIWWGVLGMLLLAAFIKFLLPVKTPVLIESNQHTNEIVVFITGAVEKPGLLSLPVDARLHHALAQAIPTQEAYLDVLNPAQRVKDGQKIVVPYKPLESTESDSAGASSPADQQSLVNINTAGVNQLVSIPGIGPVLAQRIVDYREKNGYFSSTEDIQNVSGIGPKTYENLSSYITVGP